MKSKERVYNMLFSGNAKKVELGAIDDLRDKYASIASKAVPIKRIIADAAADLSKVSDDLDSVASDAKRLKGMAKELGADNVVSLAESLEDSAKSLAKEWGKSAILAKRAAKEI